MNDISVADWSCLVSARVELDRAEQSLEDAMRRLQQLRGVEKTTISANLEAAFDRLRAARNALAAAEVKAAELG